MAADNSTLVISGQPVPIDKVAGDTITLDTLTQMLNILDDMTSHTHQLTDNYTTVCQCNCACQCACACGRGIV